jgi:predicted dehydrogenase
MSLNLGILGFAHGHVGVYCDEWLKMPGHPIKLVAGWDHDAARLVAARDKYHLSACATPAALLDTPGIDAVVIGAETSLHADLVEAAAVARKKIILQKPLALTMEDADRIVADVTREDVPFTVAWQMRVDPQNLEMKHLVTSGTWVASTWSAAARALDAHLARLRGHVAREAELNRGMWADDASHAIDFILWLLGKPQSVVAEIDTLRSPKGARRSRHRDLPLRRRHVRGGRQQLHVPRRREHDGDRRRGRRDHPELRRRSERVRPGALRARPA